jgi:hypothetical protein
VTSDKLIARKRTVEYKARVLADGSKLTGEALIVFLEHENVTLADFEQWRLSLEEGGRASAATNRRIRNLERELARKEKALAEVAALLVLKKTVQSLYQDEDGGIDGDSER